jgi:hypothetical protein
MMMMNDKGWMAAPRGISSKLIHDGKFSPFCQRGKYQQLVVVSLKINLYGG